MAVTEMLSPSARAKTTVRAVSVQADGSHGVGAEMRDPEDIDDAEQRFHAHLEDHGHGQEEDGAVEAALGVILMAAKERFLEWRSRIRE